MHFCFISWKILSIQLNSSTTFHSALFHDILMDLVYTIHHFPALYLPPPLCLPPPLLPLYSLCCVSLFTFLSTTPCPLQALHPHLRCRYTGNGQQQQQRVQPHPPSPPAPPSSVWLHSVEALLLVLRDALPLNLGKGIQQSFCLFVFCCFVFCFVFMDILAVLRLKFSARNCVKSYSIFYT